MTECSFCRHASDNAADFRDVGDQKVCVDERTCGDRAARFEEWNEQRLAQAAHAADSNPPRPRDGKIARYWSGNDCPGPTTCDRVYIDRTTGREVMRYDAADPANTNPYYGASTDGECMSKKGLDLNEMIDPSQAVVTDAELRSRMGTHDDGYDEYAYGDDFDFDEDD